MSQSDGGGDDGLAEVPLMLDSCVVINLYATRCIEEIVTAQPGPVFITERTRSREAMWVGSGRRSDPAGDVEPIDLGPLVSRGIVSVVSPAGDDEAETLVALAAEMDDGEAECGAIAFHRGFAVATDDRKAINVFERLSPPLAVVRTTQLLQRWEREKRTSRAAMNAALRDIRERARFEPSPSDPLYAWWVERAA